MKSTMRRSGALAASGIALAVVVTGCTSGGGDSTDSQKLTILSSMAAGTPIGDHFFEVYNAFTAETGIEIEVQEGADQVSTVFETSVAAGQEPDLVHINPVANPLSWIDEGIIVPVSDYYEEWGITDRVTEGALSEWTRDSDGEQQGFPYEAYQWPVWYNTAIFEEAGVDIPTTTDELIDAAADIRAAGFQPFAVGGGGWAGQKLLLQIAQSYMTPDEAKDVFINGGWCSSDAGMQGLETFVELRDAGVFQDDAEGIQAPDQTALFMSGGAAMMSQGSWELAEMPDDISAVVQFGGLPLPDGAAYDLPTAYQGTSNGYWISSKGVEKIDAIQQFIEYMYSPEVSAGFTNEVQLITAIQTDAADLSPDLPAPLVQITTELPSTVEYAVHPDKYIPGTIVETFIGQTALAFGDGLDAAGICAALDSVYTS